MKKITKLYALGISLSALTQTMGQDLDNLVQFKCDSLYQVQLEVPNANNVIDQNRWKVVQDPTARLGDKIRAIRDLKNNPQFAQNCIDFCLIILKDSTVSISERSKAVSILGAIPEFTQQDEVAEIVLSIAKTARDLKYPLGCFDCVSFLKNNAKFSKQAADICLSIAQDPKIANTERCTSLLYFPHLLKFVPEYAQEVMDIGVELRQGAFSMYRQSVDDAVKAASEILKKPAVFPQSGNNNNLSSNAEESVNQSPHLQIALDPKASIGDRLRAAKMLKDTPEYTQQAVEVYLSIVQDPNVRVYDHLATANRLKDIPGYEQQAAQAYLSIAQYPNVHVDWRLEAAKILKGMLGFEKEAAQAHLSIAQDPKLSIKDRLDAAKVLKDMPGFAQEAGQAYLSIAHDPKLSIKDRLDAAKVLKDMPEFQRQAGVACYRIAAEDLPCSMKQEELQWSLKYRLEAAIMLMGMRGFEKQAADICFRIARDPQVSVKDRLNMTQFLLLEKGLVGEILPIIKDIFRSCDFEGWQDSGDVNAFFGKLMQTLGTESPVVQELLEAWVACEQYAELQRANANPNLPKNPNSALLVHHEVMNKREDIVNHNTFISEIADQSVILSPSVMTYLEEEIKALTIANQNTLNMLKGYFLEDCRKNPEMVNGLLDGKNLDDLMLTLDRPFVQGLLSKTTGTVLENKFHIFMEKMMDGYLNRDETPDLSDASQLFIQFLLNADECDTQTADAIERMYRILASENIIDNPTPFRMRDELKKFLNDQFTKEKEAVLSKVIEKLTGKVSSHDKKYMKALIGEVVGLYPSEEKQMIDWHGGLVSPQIREVSRQEALDSFYEFFDPEYLVKKTADLFNNGNISFGSQAGADVS